MQDEPEANHAAIAAWLDGSLTPAQRVEFETHLATCAECQAQATLLLKAKIAREVAAVATTPGRPQAVPRRTTRGLWLVLLIAVLILVSGYALGWWAWGIAHH